jgi:diaminopimelate decarboxylase
MLSTPRYEYSQRILLEKVSMVTSVTFPFGFTPRYAVKANPFPEIIKLFHEQGLWFDASSSYEADMLLELGIPGRHISLSSQQTPHNLAALISAGVRFIATSEHQLRVFLDTPNRPSTVGVRINPPVGHGHNNRTNTGGVTSSFGIWHELIPAIVSLANDASVTIDTLHLHIGSGADPSVWGEVLEVALKIVSQIETVTTLDIGGGFKVHRYGEEKEADLAAILTMMAKRLEQYAADTGRRLHIEIEPGTFMVAHAGTLVAQVDDIVSTGQDGFTFLRLNTGMNDFMRPTLYGSQHNIVVINESATVTDYVVVGHNCESGDILTPAPGDPETITTRRLKTATIGDEVRIFDTGAYGASMRARGYNAFPDAMEIMVV